LSSSKKLHLPEVTHDRRDRKDLSGEIAARYGIRIDENDPAFVVVTLNQHALAQGTAELMKQIDIRLKDFEAAVQRTEARAGKYLGAECRQQVTAIRSELQADILAAGARAKELVEEIHRVNTRAILIRFISVGVLCGLLLFGTGVWVGAYCL
jgi:hypothetical protein